MPNGYQKIWNYEYSGSKRITNLRTFSYPWVVVLVVEVMVVEVMVVMMMVVMVVVMVIMMVVMVVVMAMVVAKPHLVMYSLGILSS